MLWRRGTSFAKGYKLWIIPWELVQYHQYRWNSISFRKLIYIFKQQILQSTFESDALAAQRERPSLLRLSYPFWRVLQSWMIFSAGKSSVEREWWRGIEQESESSSWYELKIRNLWINWEWEEGHQARTLSRKVRNERTWPNEDISK